MPHRELNDLVVWCFLNCQLNCCTSLDQSIMPRIWGDVCHQIEVLYTIKFVIDAQWVCEIFAKFFLNVYSFQVLNCSGSAT